MRITQFLIVAISTLAIETAVVAQTPPRSPTPQATGSQPAPAAAVLSKQQQEAIEKLVDDRFEKSSKVSDRIQSTVNSNFSWAISLLTALIAVLGVMPIITVIIVWLLRGSVIQQIVSETRKQIEKDVAQEVKGQLQIAVAEELSNQVQVFKQDLETLKLDFINQLQNLSLTAQKEKDQIFKELANITPSIIQTEFVTPEIQKKIQDLTKQLEALKDRNLQLSLSADDYVKQGDALYFEDRFHDAVASFDKAIQINPTLFAAWIGKGKALRKAKQPQAALAANEKAIELDATNYWSWFGRGYTLIDLERYEEALAAFDQAIQIKPSKHYGWRNRGYVLTKLKRYEDAWESFENSLKLDPTSSGTFYWRAYWYLVQNQRDRAIENLQRAISLSERHLKSVKTDPDFTSLRGDDRFEQLMRE